MKGKLLGQREHPLNLEIFNKQYRIQLRKRGIHPSIADSEHYTEYLNSGKRVDMNVEKMKYEAKKAAESETRRIQDLCPSLIPDVAKYTREFVDRVERI